MAKDLPPTNFADGGSYKRARVNPEHLSSLNSLISSDQTNLVSNLGENDSIQNVDSSRDEDSSTKDYSFLKPSNIDHTSHYLTIDGLPYSLSTNQSEHKNDAGYSNSAILPHELAATYSSGNLPSGAEQGVKRDYSCLINTKPLTDKYPYSTPHVNPLLKAETNGSTNDPPDTTVQEQYGKNEEYAAAEEQTSCEVKDRTNEKVLSYKFAVTEKTEDIIRENVVDPGPLGMAGTSALTCSDKELCVEDTSQCAVIINVSGAVECISRESSGSCTNDRVEEKTAEILQSSSEVDHLTTTKDAAQDENKLSNSLENEEESILVSEEEQLCIETFLHDTKDSVKDSDIDYPPDVHQEDINFEKIISSIPSKPESENIVKVVDTVIEPKSIPPEEKKNDSSGIGPTPNDTVANNESRYIGTRSRVRALSVSPPSSNGPTVDNTLNAMPMRRVSKRRQLKIERGIDQDIQIKPIDESNSKKTKVKKQSGVSKGDDVSSPESSNPNSPSNPPVESFVSDSDDVRCFHLVQDLPGISYHLKTREVRLFYKEKRGRVSRSFNISKHGVEQAVHMAKELRGEWVANGKIKPRANCLGKGRTWINKKGGIMASVYIDGAPQKKFFFCQNQRSGHIFDKQVSLSQKWYESMIMKRFLLLRQEEVGITEDEQLELEEKIRQLDSKIQHPSDDYNPPDVPEFPVTPPTKVEKNSIKQETKPAKSAIKRSTKQPVLEQDPKTESDFVDEIIAEGIRFVKDDSKRGTLLPYCGVFRVFYVDTSGWERFFEYCIEEYGYDEALRLARRKRDEWISKGIINLKNTEDISVVEVCSGVHWCATENALVSSVCVENEVLRKVFQTDRRQEGGRYNRAYMKALEWYADTVSSKYRDILDS